MARNVPVVGDQPDPPLFWPVPAILAGAGLTAAGWLWGLALPSVTVPFRVLLLVAGLLVVGAGLTVHLPRAHWHLDARLGTAALFLLGAGASYLAHLSLLPVADSIALFLRLLALVGVAAAILAAVPRGWRYGLVSLLIAFHLGVIVAGTLVIPPPPTPGGLPPWYSSQPEVRFGGSPPWLPAQIWTRFGRPYLQFLQMNNAYHFYAPEPGPCALLWFRVEFEDGYTRWTRFPDHKAAGSNLARRRYGALATAVGQTVPVPVTPEMLAAREKAANRYNPPILPSPELPIHAQYREPAPQCKLLVASYARYVGRTTRHPRGDPVGVRAVRVYRADFRNPPVEHFQAGRDPLDPALYQVWYQGEFDVAGNLAESSKNDLLYWLIPIVRVPDGTEPPAGPGAPLPGAGDWTGRGRIVNHVWVHAGDPADTEGTP